MITTVIDTSGVYSISFLDTPEKYYIGCSASIKNRIADHLSALKRNVHKNKKLQYAYNQYGTPIIQVLDQCPIVDMFHKEQFYINKYNSFTDGYNLTLGGEGAVAGELNGQSKYSLDDYYSVLKLLVDTNYSHSKISTITNISINVIKKISSLSSHRYLEALYPEDYAILVEKSEYRDNSAASKGIVYPTIISPDNIEYNVTNIHQFAKEHGLQYQNLHKVLTGSRKTHKGWKVK